jgi:5-formyltetrahydrofolate cyclo-ligase
MKDALREILVQKRKDLTMSQVFDKSKKIKKLLFSLEDLKNSSTILFYVSYNKEVNTYKMIKETLGKKAIVVPVVNVKNGVILLSKLVDWSDLSIGSFGILEPKKNRIHPISIQDIDLIIVPGVGFDKKGNRIGHGKGYYDKLLQQAPSILKIGLAFECQIMNSVPCNSYDVPVDTIITEKRVLDCKTIM